MSNGVHGIVFDMDDTLYKEHTYRLSGLLTVARHFAAACGMMPEQLLEAMQAEPSRAFETVEHLAAKHGVGVSVTDQLIVYRSHRPDIELDPEALQVLVELRRRGYRLGLLTDGRAWGQLNKIAALGLGNYIDPALILPTVLYDTDKHSDLAWHLMEQRMGADAASLTYVGDNLAKDFAHPNRLGWHTVMLRDVRDENIHRQRPADWPAENQPQRTVDSLLTLLDIYK